MTILCWALLCWPAIAAPVYPELTGRVVDNAHLLSPGAFLGLTDKLTAHEKRTGEQLVVVTLPTLDGQEIEDYGVQLGRHWQIGQKNKNNGALLIVAVKERRARIEVGYGLEGELTDALSRAIIEQDMVPHFRKGEMEQGVVEGARAMLYVLGDRPEGDQPPASVAQARGGQLSPAMIGFILVLVLTYIIICIRHPELAWFTMRVLSSAGSGSSGGSSQRFSGGGGSFGGGGASGRW